MAVVFVLFKSATNSAPRFVTTPTWDAVFAGAGTGTALASSLLAVGAALSMSSRETWLAQSGFAPSRSFIRRFVARAWPMYAAFAFAYTGLVAQISEASHPTALSPRHLLIPVSYFCTVVMFGIIGAVLARVLPISITVTVAAIGSYVLIALSLTSGNAMVANLFGFGLVAAPHSLSTQVPLNAFVPPLVLASCIVLALLVLERLRWGAIAATMCVVFGLSFSISAAAETTFPVTVARDSRELVCDENRVCLWPESLSGDNNYADTAARLLANLDTNGIEHPVTVSNRVAPIDWPMVPTEEIEWGVEPGMTSAVATVLFAYAIQRSTRCEVGDVPTEDQYREADRALVALVLALGADPGPLENLARSPFVEGISAQSENQIKSLVGISDSQSGFEIYKHWLEGIAPCM